MKTANIEDKLLRLLRPTPASNKTKIDELERQVEQLEERLALERREAELRAKLKQLRSERREVKPVRLGRLVIGIGAALVLLLFIAKIAGC